MSTLKNKVQLIGNIGNEPKITNLESGSTVARFSMATNEYYRNAEGEKVQATQWHNVVAWNKKAELIEQYAFKGKELAIEGKLISRSYTNDSGVICYVTEIVASEILLMGSKNEVEAQKEKENTSANTKKEVAETAKKQQKRRRNTTKKEVVK